MVVVVYRRRWEGLRRDVQQACVVDIGENRVATKAAATVIIRRTEKKRERGGRERGEQKADRVDRRKRQRFEVESPANDICRRRRRKSEGGGKVLKGRRQQ